ncbi:hypothetical protein N2152v2_005581 [Parachlorella kessleri]
MEALGDDPAERPYSVQDFAFNPQQHSAALPLPTAKQQRTAEKRAIVAEWLFSVLGTATPVDSDEAFRSALSDGVILCRLLNVLQPGTVARVIEGGVDSCTGEVIQTFENVSNFIRACRSFTAEVFSARDLEDCGERPQVVECLMSLRDWHMAALAAGQPARQVPVFSPAGSAYSSPSPQRFGGSPQRAPHSYNGGSASPTRRPPCLNNEYATASGGPSPVLGLTGSTAAPAGSGFSFTPIAQDFVQRHGARTAQPDAGIPQLMRSCTNLLKQKMGMPATPPVGPRPGGMGSGAMQTETALEAVGPVLESVLANLTAEYEKRLLAKDQEMKLSHEAMERMRKQISGLQVEVSYWQTTCASIKALPAHPTDGLTSEEREEYEERIRAEREAAQLKLQEAEAALQQKEAELHVNLEEKEAELEELRGELDKVTDIHQRLAAVREENRLLYNTVQDLRGNIRVFCRVRPQGATGDASQIVVDTLDDQQLRLYNPKAGKDLIFKFDRVFGAESTQEEVYDETKPLIRSVLDGYNVCIFAYGQTGSGKTHTMSGTDVEQYVGRGINYRALDDLFTIQQQRADEVEYDISVQMLEIYNENLRDLLVDESEARQQRSLELRDTQRSGCNVPDAIQVAVSCTDDVLRVMALGARNRAVAETKMNERSSRSHSVLTVMVDGTNLTTHEKTHGCLHLIDLAGSERVGKSGAEGEQLKEATHINTSLSALGHVMTSLASKAKHVPFRNSKLTRLLEDSLSGQAKSMMFIHVAPEWNSASETRCTLDFGKRVTEVTLGAAKKNTESGAAHEAKELEKRLRVEQQKAAQEAERAEAEARRAEAEAQQRLRLEAELEQLRAQLSRQALSSCNSSPESSDCETIRAYRPPSSASTAAAPISGGVSLRLAGRLPTPPMAGLPRPDSSAGSSTPRGATAGRAVTPRGSVGAKPTASLSRLNLAGVDREGDEKPHSGLRAPSMSKLNLARVHSSEENVTPLSARSKMPTLSKIPTPASGSLTARAMANAKASPFSSIPRPQTARESPEEARARRAALPVPRLSAAASGTRLAKPSAGTMRSIDSSRSLARAQSASSVNSDGSLNSSRSLRGVQSGSFSRGGWK